MRWSVALAISCNIFILSFDCLFSLSAVSVASENTHRSHGSLGLLQLRQLPVRWFPAVGYDLLAPVDPLHGGCGAEVDLLGLKAAGAGVENDPT